MLKSYETKSMTPELRAQREAWYEQRILEAMLAEDHPEAKTLRAARRHELRAGSKFPPERISADAIRVLDARQNREHPEVIYDPSAPEKPLMIGNARVVKTASQRDRWR